MKIFKRIQIVLIGVCLIVVPAILLFNSSKEEVVFNHEYSMCLGIIPFDIEGPLSEDGGRFQHSDNFLDHFIITNNGEETMSTPELVLRNDNFEYYYKLEYIINREDSFVHEDKFLLLEDNKIRLMSLKSGEGCKVWLIRLRKTDVVNGDFIIYVPQKPINERICLRYKNENHYPKRNLRIMVDLNSKYSQAWYLILQSRYGKCGVITFFLFAFFVVLFKGISLIPIFKNTTKKEWIATLKKSVLFVFGSLIPGLSFYFNSNNPDAELSMREQNILPKTVFEQKLGVSEVMYLNGETSYSRRIPINDFYPEYFTFSFQDEHAKSDSLDKRFSEYESKMTSQYYQRAIPGDSLDVGVHWSVSELDDIRVFTRFRIKNNSQRKIKKTSIVKRKGVDKLFFIIDDDDFYQYSVFEDTLKLSDIKPNEFIDFAILESNIEESSELFFESENLFSPITKEPKYIECESELDFWITVWLSRFWSQVAILIVSTGGVILLVYSSFQWLKRKII